MFSGLRSNRIHVTGLCNQDTKKRQMFYDKLEKKVVIRLQLHSVKRGLLTGLQLFKTEDDILVCNWTKQHTLVKKIK